MQIVVLDGYTLNPGDLSWEELETLGPTTVYDRSLPQEVLPRAKDATILLTNKTVLSREIIEQLPSLKYIGVLATGYNVVDVDAAWERGILVANVPTYGSASVAQMTFAHLLNLAQHVAHHAQTVAEGRWTASKDWCYWDYPLLELSGKILGIVGFGRIGQTTAQIALGFGMSVFASDAQPLTPVAGVHAVDLDTLLRISDVVSLHCPLTPATRNLVNRRRLARMKPTAFLINTSRGPLVDEPALAEALNSGRLAGAGLDVLSVEPPCPDNPLLTAKNCFITPHIAWATKAARQRLLDIVVENVRTFLAGKPQNLITA
jgi:glycerate dehydrogenase